MTGSLWTAEQLPSPGTASNADLHRTSLPSTQQHVLASISAFLTYSAFSSCAEPHALLPSPAAKFFTWTTLDIGECDGLSVHHD